MTRNGQQSIMMKEWLTINDDQRTMNERGEWSIINESRMTKNDQQSVMINQLRMTKNDQPLLIMISDIKKLTDVHDAQKHDE